jgi:signal transduction histidine kinase
VTDNGHGINEADREAVFDRFHRSDSARSGPGHGLGLSIADTIARNHGGSIQAGVGESDGASFTVRLPASGGNI